MNSSNESNNAALIEAVREDHKTETLSFINSEEKLVNLLVVARDGGGKDVVGIKNHLDSYLKRPETRSGTSKHTKLTSLIGHINAFKSDKSAVFAWREISQITAVYDYHTKDETSFRLHKATFNAVLSEQWKTWAQR